MKRSHVFAAVAALAIVCLCRTGSAQFVTYYSPVVEPAQTVVWSPVVEPVRTVTYRPVIPTVVARPVESTVYYAPTAQAVTVARPVVATTAWAPVTYTTTRRRPILGGTVTRVRQGFVPVTVAQPAW